MIKELIKLVLITILGFNIAYAKVGFRPGEIDEKTDYFYKVPITLEVEWIDNASHTYTIEESYDDATTWNALTSAESITYTENGVGIDDYTWIPKMITDPLHGQLRLLSNESGTFATADSSELFTVSYGSSTFTSLVDSVWLGKVIHLEWPLNLDQLPEDLALQYSLDDGHSWANLENIPNNGLYSYIITDIMQEHDIRFKLTYRDDDAANGISIAETGTYHYKPLTMNIIEKDDISEFIYASGDPFISHFILNIDVETPVNFNIIFNDIITTTTASQNVYQFETILPEQFTGEISLVLTTLSGDTLDFVILNIKEKWFHLNGNIEGTYEINDELDIGWQNSDNFKVVKLEKKYNDSNWIDLTAAWRLYDNYKYKLSKVGEYYIKATVYDGYTEIISERGPIIVSNPCQDEIDGLHNKIVELENEIVEWSSICASLDRDIIRLENLLANPTIIVFDKTTDIKDEYLLSDIPTITDTGLIVNDIIYNDLISSLIGSVDTYSYIVYDLLGMRIQEEWLVSSKNDIILNNDIGYGPTYIGIIITNGKYKIFKFIRQ